MGEIRASEVESLLLSAPQWPGIKSQDLASFLGPWGWVLQQGLGALVTRAWTELKKKKKKGDSTFLINATVRREERKKAHEIIELCKTSQNFLWFSSLLFLWAHVLEIELFEKLDGVSFETPT